MQLVGDLQRLSTNRSLAALVAAGAVSALGDWLYLAALPIIVFQATGDPALVGLAAAGRLTPFLVLSIPAGLVADRFDRRRVLIATESLRCLLMLAMAALYSARSDVAPLIAIATIAAAAGTMAMPAQGALIPQLARDTDELGVANATSTTLENLASILGPIVAGILVLAGGLGLACVVNGVSFAVVVGLLVRTRTAARSRPDALASPAPPESEPAAKPEDDPVPSVFEVLRRASRPVVLDTAISFACGALGVLPVVIAVDHLGAGEAFAGVLGAAGGIGAVLGGVAAGILVNRTTSRAIAAGVVIAAAALGLLAASDSALVAVVASGTALGALVMLDTLNVTALQRRVPGSHLGRAFGILHTSAAAWLMAGSAIPPIVAGIAGVGSALVLTSLVVAGLGAVALVPARGSATTELRAAVASA